MDSCRSWRLGAWSPKYCSTLHLPAGCHYRGHFGVSVSPWRRESIPVLMATATKSAVGLTPPALCERSTSMATIYKHGGQISPGPYLPQTRTVTPPIVYLHSRRTITTRQSSSSDLITFGVTRLGTPLSTRSPPGNAMRQGRSPVFLPRRS